MAVNLTPQYHEAEQEYKKAQSAEDRLAALQKMWKEVPKHKASEKLQSDLKQKISAVKEEIETEKKVGKKGGGVSYKIPKQGAGQIVLLGAPNAGKSQLVCKLTRATPQVAPFPFTTREPIPGMMAWEDVQVQLVDLPPITPDFMEGYISSMTRSANGAALIVDLADDDGPFTADAVINRLADVKTILGGTIDPDEDVGILHIPTILIANKIDADGAADRLEIVREMYGPRFPIHVVSAEAGQGMPELRDALYRMLDAIRIYTKKPGKPPDMESPYTIPSGSNLMELAERIHRELPEKLKSARVWGTGVFEGQTVPRDHVLHDKDVVEIHV